MGAHGAHPRLWWLLELDSGRFLVSLHPGMTVLGRGPSAQDHSRFPLASSSVAEAPMCLQNPICLHPSPSVRRSAEAGVRGTVSLSTNCSANPRGRRDPALFISQAEGDASRNSSRRLRWFIAGGRPTPRRIHIGSCRSSQRSSSHLVRDGREEPKSSLLEDIPPPRADGSGNRAALCGDNSVL